MNEIQALGQVDEALAGLEDTEERSRVLRWAVAKYGSAEDLKKLDDNGSDQDKGHVAGDRARDLGDREIPGLALVSDAGEFRLTVRDPKATTTNDAAIRLALVSIFAYCQLTGEKSASSRRIVKPVLEEWRAYTGNTRRAIAIHQGIIRDGDALSLDQHAKREAEGYIDEILDDDVKGNWQANGRTSGRKSRATKTTKKA